MRSFRSIASFGLAAAFFNASVALAADPVPSLDLRGFHAPTDPASGLYAEPASTPGHGAWNVGLFTNYVFRPIVLRDASSGALASSLISHQVTSDLVANVGIGKRFALGVDLPFLLYQTGDAPTAASTRVVGSVALPRQSLGDMGIDAKVNLLGGAHTLGGFSLALHERFTLPTGDPASFLGESGVTSETRLLADYRLVVLGLYGAVGFKARAQQQRFACEATPVGLDGRDTCSSRFGNELPFGFGLSMKPQALGLDSKGRVTVFAEAHGYLPLSPLRPFESQTPAEAEVGLGARYAIGDASILAGVEHAVIGGVGNAPLRATLAFGWAPREHDVDHDGIPDDVDLCRELPEDKDGFQDDDGCPEGDNDDDGVPDDDDKCPTLKEDEDGFQDDDGCPDPDNDGDGIVDVADACPNEAGPANADPKKNGCIERDPDHDGIVGDADKCPAVAEDKDGFQDDDGCPEADNDKDGIVDAEDACPNVAGIANSDPKRSGCPDPDRDKDTYLDPLPPGSKVPGFDACPDAAETWNGFEDDDGCPDETPPKSKAKALVEVRRAKTGLDTLGTARSITFASPTLVDAASMTTVRAIAALLLANPGAELSVSVRPPEKGKGQPEDSVTSATTLASAISAFLPGRSRVKSVAWNAKGSKPAEIVALRVEHLANASDDLKNVDETPLGSASAPPPPRGGGGPSRSGAQKNDSDAPGSGDGVLIEDD